MEKPMNITQTLESLSILTDSDALFCELRALISKNFTKTLANKDKIISFYEESEIPQRKCFLKFIKKLYEKQGNELDVTFAKYKTIKLSLVQRNALTNIYNIDIDFFNDEMIFMLNNTPRAFASYILQNFKGNESKFDEKNHKFSLKIKKESDFDLIEEIISRREHLKFIVNFNYNEVKFKEFKRNYKVQNSAKFKSRFSALANLLEENFEILGCSNKDSFETVRDSYLALAKIYHPDRHSNKSESIKNEYNAKFKKIQTAYEALKPFFKNQENFIKVG